MFLTGVMGMVQALIWMGWGTVSQSMYYAYPDWNDTDIGLLGNITHPTNTRGIDREVLQASP